MAYHTVHHTFRPDYPGLAQFGGNVFFLQGFAVRPLITDPVLWTLSAEVCFYALAPLFGRLPSSVLAGLAALSALIYAAHPHFSRISLWDDRYAIPALSLLWAWLLGFLVYRKRQSGRSGVLLIGISGVLLIGISGLALGLYSVQLYSFAVTLVGLTTFGLFIGGFFLSSHLPLSVPMGRVLSYGGDLSYPLYLVHLCVILALQYVRPAPHWSVYLLSIAAVTLIVHHGVELPVRLWLRRRVKASEKELSVVA